MAAIASASLACSIAAACSAGVSAEAVSAAASAAAFSITYWAASRLVLNTALTGTIVFTSETADQMA